MSSLKLLESAVAYAFYKSFAKLRPVQEAAIEPLINGKNIVLSSGTGSGKTEAVLAPLISRYWRQTVNTESLVIIYIAPTKALVNDLEKRLYEPLTSLGLRIGIRHGDQDDLTSGKIPHILITTPESLEVLLFRKDSALQTIKALIVDEVHLLYNTQRGLQLSILIQRLKADLERDIQWAALSATVGKLEDIQQFLFGKCENTLFLSFPTHRAIESCIKSIDNEESFLKFIEKLMEGNFAKLLIFANSRRECERLASILQKEQCFHSSIFTHYSSLSSEIRIEIERKFSSARTAICIATSTLELGIDIGDISAVILWGVPNNIESFLQRIGRSNRRQNKTNVICLVTDTSENIKIDTLKFLALIDAAKEGNLPIRSPYNLYGAIGQQCLSMIASNNGRFTRIADLCKSFEKKDYLTRTIIENICIELENNAYLKKHGFKNQYGADSYLYNLVDYRLIYGNFSASSQTVELRYKSKVLGDIPSTNLIRIRQGNLVRFSAKIWKITKISRDFIMLTPINNQTGSNITDFVYGGSQITGDIFTYKRIWELIHSNSIHLDFLSKSLGQEINECISKIKSSCSYHQIPFYRTSNGVKYFTFGGNIINKAIAIITNKEYYKVDDISLLVNSPIDWSTIPRNPQEYESIFHLLFESSSEQSIYQKLLPQDLQLLEFMQAWLKDEVIAHTLNRLSTSEGVEFNFDNLLDIN